MVIKPFKSNMSFQFFVGFINFENCNSLLKRTNKNIVYKIFGLEEGGGEKYYWISIMEAKFHYCRSVQKRVHVHIMYFLAKNLSPDKIYLHSSQLHTL